jgi:hypothetical protein
VQHPRQRYGDDTYAERRERHPQLSDALAIRAASARDVHDVADLEDIATVESAWRRDVMHVVAECRNRLLCGDGFRLADRRTRSGNDYRPAEHDHRVFDKNAIRAVVRGRHLDRVPPRSLKRCDIALPLLDCSRDVDRLALDVRDDSFVEVRARAADQCGRAHLCSLGISSMSDPRRRPCATMTTGTGEWSGSWSRAS